MRAALLLSTALASVMLPQPAALASEVPVAAVMERALEWRVTPPAQAWAALVGTPAPQRQEARWTYALSLVSAGLGAEAIGMLDLMREQDAGVETLAHYRLARGMALVQMRRHAEGLAALELPALAERAEACAWRLVALSALSSDKALDEVECALPAVKALPTDRRAPFISALAAAAIQGDKPGVALDWLRLLDQELPLTHLLRAQAQAKSGQYDAAEKSLENVSRSGDAEQRAQAQLMKVVIGLDRGVLDPVAAGKALDALRFGWRGGEVEKQALLLNYRVAVQTKDIDRALANGAALVRYHRLDDESASVITALRGYLTAALDPKSGLPVDRAGGLYWNYRDLAPTGAEGDLLVSRLAARLEEAGLYDRAAELLEHQLFARARDVAQGPVSIRVATLFLRAGHPERAVRAIRNSEGPAYPGGMTDDRKRVQAIALARLGKTDDAVAIVEGLPDSARLRAEFYWKGKNWQALADAFPGVEPKGKPLDDQEQIIVLRQAIALGMLNKKAELQHLRALYQARFRDLGAASSFEMLTAPVETLASETIGKALAVMPSASPAGALGDLL